jgi:hypothetical protein
MGRRLKIFFLLPSFSETATPYGAVQYLVSWATPVMGTQELVDDEMDPAFGRLIAPERYGSRSLDGVLQPIKPATPDQKAFLGHCREQVLLVIIVAVRVADANQW